MLIIPPVHLVVMQPPGYVHSLGFLDQARYLRYQLRRLGAKVTLAKNRLREDAINVVFGAHLGFPAERRTRHTCVFFNLEQLGRGGAQVNPAYLQLLRSSAVVDYDADNVASYSRDPADVPVVPLMFAPYLDRPVLPLEERPIDLLFFGSVNARRQALIRRVEDCGHSVSVFDAPLYGPERDDFIRQAKAVLNCHYYESSRFEQARVAHCLSLGTPVVSERRADTRPPAAFEHAVGWFDDAGLDGFFRHQFGRPAWFEAARGQLAEFTRHDPIDAYAELMAFMAGVHQGHLKTRVPGPHRPTRLNLAAGKDYEPGWLNLDPAEATQPDLQLDLGQPLRLPLQQPTRHGGQVRIDPGQVELIRAGDVLTRVQDVQTLMGNALRLLAEGGEIEVEVPYEKALTAWQDPSRVRAMNENSWGCYIERFWELGWFEHRFEMIASGWLDLNRQPATRDAAAFMRVRLRKVATSPRERTLARAMQVDFGGLDDDLEGDPAVRPQPAEPVSLTLRAA